MSRPDDHIRAYLRKKNLYDTFETRAHRLGSYYHSSENGSKGTTDKIAQAARHFCLGQRSSMLEKTGGVGSHILFQVDGAGEFKLNQIDVDKIRAVAFPSPFGDLIEGRDRVDAEVREAFEIPAASFRFLASYNKSTVDVTSVFYNLKDKIAATLFTRDTELEIVPYKLNLYPKGGHFRPHVDTPKHPERLVATLVMQLPTPFEGGALVVRHNGISERMEAGGQWMAFYPDCQHEVERVTKGNRITITYHVLAKDPALAAAARPDMRREAATSLLAGMIKEPMGFLLTHVYTQAAVTRGILRGIDAKLRSYLETVLPAGSKTEILPVMAQLSGSMPYDDLATRNKEGIYLADAKALELDSQERPDDGQQMSSDLKFVSCLAQPVGVRMRRSYEDAIEHTGNESREGLVDYLYFNTALIVTPAAKSLGKRKQSEAAKADDAAEKTAKVEEEEEEEEEMGHTFASVSGRAMISRASDE